LECPTCAPDQECQGGTCCYPTAASLEAALEPGGPATIQLCPNTRYRGNFTLSRNVTIIGAGATSSIFDGEASGTVLTVAREVTAMVQGVGIRNGAGTIFPGGFRGGGGVLNRGTLTLIECHVTNNTILADAASFGGGISNGEAFDGMNASLTLTRCLVADNRVTGPALGGNVGAGILSSSTAMLTLIASVVTHNTASAPSFAEGGGMYLLGSSLSMENNSQVTRNSATGEGGGIKMLLGSTATIVDSSVRDNDAGGGGGGLLVTGDAGNLVTFRGTSVVAGNNAGDSGGGIRNDALGGVVFEDASCVVNNSPNDCVGATCPVCPPP
jgi:hypothetical protein